MNKKFSTLLAGALLAFSAGISAQTAVTPGTALKKGGEYFLLNTDKVLAVQKDSLALVATTDIADMTRAERAFATWTVSYDVSATGAYAYNFVNKGTGQKLQLPASGKALAYVANGINQFAWLDNGNAAASKLISTTTAAGAKLMPYPVFVAQKEITGATGSMVNYAHLTDAVGYEGIQVVQNYGATTLADAIDISALDFASSGAAATKAEIQAAKDMVKAIDAAFAQFGLTRSLAGLADYKTWADAVDNFVLGANATYDVSASAIYTGKDDANTAVSTILVGSPYGYACKVDGKWEGVIYDADGDGIMTNSEIYAKGVKFVKGNAMTELQAALLNAADFVADPDDLIDDVIDDADNDPTYVANFVKEFKTGAQEDEEVSTALDFTMGGSPATTTNKLADKNIQLVQRNLLIDESNGQSVASATMNVSDFNAATMIYDKDADKYLYVSSDTYEADDTKSTYFKVEWVSLKDLAKSIGAGALVADVTYNNLSGKPHAGSAIFKVNYNPNNGAVEIAPRFLYQKKASTLPTDTAGVTYTLLNGSTDSYKYVLSLKKFSTAVELTVVDKTAESVYPIYATAAAADSDWELASVSSDVYYIQYISNKAAEKANNGKFFTANGLINGSVEAFNHLPANQWTLVKDVNGLVKVVNRADKTNVFADKSTNKFDNVQLYKAGGNYVSVYGGDTLKLTSVASAFKMDSTIGYFAYDAKKNDVLKYQLTYFNELDATKNVGVKKDSTLFVDKEGEGIWFQVKPTTPAGYGADAIKDVSKKLYKATYTIEAIVKGKAYKVVELANGKYGISDKSSNVAAVTFDVKELMHKDTCWYVLNDLTNSGYKASVDDNTLELFKEATSEVRTSMFALTQGAAPKYRRLGETVADGIAKNDTAYVEFFKANEPNRFLYENAANIVAQNGTEFSKDSLNFLGMYNKADMKRNASIFVDTAYVRNDTIKPLYMLALGVTYTAAKAAVPCPDHGMTCEHAIPGHQGYTEGRYLVTLNDSIDNNPSALYQNNIRLAFVPAKHIADTLVIAKSEFTGVKDDAGKDSLIVNGGNMHPATFAFRLVNDDPADFYMEATDGQYVRIHNGVPVLVTNLADATIFNVNKTEEIPTANEDLNVSSISIIAGQGNVQIAGAAGKKVVISNILGQVVVNTVITSDNATIAAPAGIVVVAVEGEEAVKAIVK